MAEGMGHRGCAGKFYQIARRVKVDRGTCEAHHAVWHPVTFEIRDMPDQALSANVGGNRGPWPARDNICSRKIQRRYAHDPPPLSAHPTTASHALPPTH